MRRVAVQNHLHESVEESMQRWPLVELTFTGVDQLHMQYMTAHSLAW